MLLQKLSIFQKSVVTRLLFIKNRFKLPEKWKGGRIEKWSLYWENLFLDYKGVAVDVIQGAKDRPLKAALISAGLGVMFTAVKTNPDGQSLQDTLANATSSLAMVGDSIRNPASEEHIQFIQRCINQDVLRRADLIFFTLAWVADYSKDCNIYAAQCRYLKPKYLTFHERVVDIGAFGVWWNIRRKMHDFDINPKEWESGT